jgi:hypothetical protein
MLALRTVWTKNVLYGQKAEILNAKPGDTFSNHWVLNRKVTDEVTV